MDTTVDRQITDRFKSGRQDVQDLIAPLIELASQSSSLVVGYGAPQMGVRSEMIPYFHVCGTPADKEPLRVLVIGGWVGTEIITPYACLSPLNPGSGSPRASKSQPTPSQIWRPIAKLSSLRANNTWTE